MNGDRQPKYEELREALISTIRHELTPHAPLPSERELMRAYGMSRDTVRTAIGGLIDEGLAYRIQGSGTYVAETIKVSKSLRLSSFSEDMRDRGLRPSTKVLEAVEVPADARIARDLGISPGEAVILIHRVRLADGQPMALERTYLPSSRVPGLLEHDIAGSLYDVLESVYSIRLQRALQQIRGTVLRVDEAALLEVPAHSPALHVSRLSVDRWGAPVESSETIYRADRYTFTMTITRDPTRRGERP